MKTNGIIMALLILIVSCTSSPNKDNSNDNGQKEVSNEKGSSGVSVDFLTAVPAESELIFNGAIKRAGGVNKFDHSRVPATVETQAIVRSQSDMMYSHSVFDASQGLSIEIPKSKLGYQSAQVFDLYHGQLGMVYSGESLDISPDDISTDVKHVYIFLRTSTDQGLEIANRAQDDVKITAKSNTPFIGPGYNQEQLKEAKRILAGAAPFVKAKTAYSTELVPNSVMLKDGSDIDQYNYIYSSLLGWGLMPNNDAYYPQLVIDDAECSTVNFPKPPVQYGNGGYWSLTAYGLDGYLHNNNSVVSSLGAESNPDGSYTVYVGNSDKCKTHKNHVDMPEGGTSITLRLYRPTSLEDAKGFERIFQAQENK